MSCAQSLFGGRHIFTDHYSAANVSTPNGSLPWYTEVESQAGFATDRRTSPALQFQMQSADTAGGYADYISQRVRGFLGSANMELLLKIYGDASTENYVSAFFRGNNATGKAADFESCQMQSGSIDNLYVTLDVTENITSYVFTPTNADAYLRMAVIGRDHYVKGWLAANPEPNTWGATFHYAGARNPPNNFNTFGIGYAGGNSGVANFFGFIFDIDVWDLSLCHEGAMVGSF